MEAVKQAVAQVAAIEVTDEMTTWDVLKPLSEYAYHGTTTEHKFADRMAYRLYEFAEARKDAHRNLVSNANVLLRNAEWLTGITSIQSATSSMGDAYRIHDMVARCTAAEQRFMDAAAFAEVPTEVAVEVLRNVARVATR